MFKYIIFFCLLILFYPTPAHAYLDPGTGSMLLTALVGIGATFVFMVRGFWYRGLSAIYGLFGKKLQRVRPASIVFYSEGRQYWQTFRPVIDSLAQMGEPCTYLTSDADDPGLTHQAEGLTATYIGEGTRAFTTLAALEADVCAMTTPGLDVMQIRRSRGVRHYAHVVHAVGDVSMYRKFGLDYYDSLLASGPHQEASVRELEALRGTESKQVLLAGCAYLDDLVQQKTTLQTPPHEGYNVLVAPTWGPEGLLRKFGARMLLPLAQAGYAVTVRPHPQSLRVERELIDNIKTETALTPNIVWDETPNGFAAMAQADVLISDWSSIVFDFALVFERPVLIMDYSPSLDVYDAHDLKDIPWDFRVQAQLGRKIGLADIPTIPQIVASVLDDPDFVGRIRAFRDANVYNFGKSGPAIAQQLVTLRAQVRQKD